MISFSISAKTVQKYKDDLEKRLGRKREPLSAMRQLVLKPVSVETTEEEIFTAFKHHAVESVEFKDDLLK